MRTLIVLRKDNYGRPTLYPVCDASHTFARIAGTKTLTIDTLIEARKLGFVVQITYPEFNQTQMDFEDTCFTQA